MQCDHPGGRINSPPNSPSTKWPAAEGSGNAFPASSMEEAVAAVTSGLPVPSEYIKMHPEFKGLDPFFRHGKVGKLQPAQEGHDPSLIN